MMRYAVRQRLSAIVLIVAMLPLLAAQVGHTHHHQPFRCEDCAYHVPHGVHFSETVETIDHCLICQSIVAPYECAICVGVEAPMLSAHPVVVLQKVCYHSAGAGTALVRGPPLLSA